MVFCDFVVCILIFSESSLQLIEFLQLQYALVFQDCCHQFSRPETIFNQMGVVSVKLGVVSVKVGVVTQMCAPPPFLPELFPPPKKNTV